LPSASLAVFAEGKVVFGGSITAGNTITVSITGATASTPTKYTYIVKSTDTVETVAVAMAAVINAGKGDPNVYAVEETGLATIDLIARQAGPNGNNIAISTTLAASATVSAVASGATLRGGGSSGIIAPGSVMLYRGTNLADTTASASPDAP